MSENEAGRLTNGANGEGVPVHDEHGRFLPGNAGGPGNPHASRVAAWRGALVAAVTAADIGEIARTLVKEAREGKPWAVALLLDRCLGKARLSVELLEKPRLPLRIYLEDSPRRIEITDKPKAGGGAAPLSEPEKPRVPPPPRVDAEAESDDFEDDDGEAGWIRLG